MCIWRHTKSHLGVLKHESKIYNDGNLICEPSLICLPNEITFTFSARFVIFSFLRLSLSFSSGIVCLYVCYWKTQCSDEHGKNGISHIMLRMSAYWLIIFKFRPYLSRLLHNFYFACSSKWNLLRTYINELRVLCLHEKWKC